MAAVDDVVLSGGTNDWTDRPRASFRRTLTRAKGELPGPQPSHRRASSPLGVITSPCPSKKLRKNLTSISIYRSHESPSARRPPARALASGPLTGMRIFWIAYFSSLSTDEARSAPSLSAERASARARQAALDLVPKALLVQRAHPRVELLLQLAFLRRGQLLRRLGCRRRAFERALAGRDSR